MSDSTALRSSALTTNTAITGIGLMVFGLFMFSANDVMGKWLVSTYSVGQILLIRSLAALIILSPFILRTGLRSFMRLPHPRIQIGRAICATIDVSFFYWAVAYLPLADVMTFYLAGPIYVTAMSAFFLGERVRLSQWIAVLAGFCGVLIALGPSIASFSWPSLIALGGSFAFSGLMILTRLSRGVGDTHLVTIQIVACLVFGMIVTPFNWILPDSTDFIWLSMLGIISMSAYLCVNRALKLAPASVVIPYQYTIIIWAIVFGYLFFDEVPKITTLVGAIIIIAAGICLFLREQSRPSHIAEAQASK